MKHVILADNQCITSIGLKTIIKEQLLNKEEYELYMVSSKKELLMLLAVVPFPYIILDYTLFDFSSPNELLILSQRYTEANWLLFSEDLSDNFLRQLAANDYPFSIVLKNCGIDEINEGIEILLHSSIYICKNIQSHIIALNKNMQNVLDYSLTSTEQEILKEIASGKTTKEIASDRNLSFHTIITHRKNIFRKLEVNNVHEATKYAIKAGIVDLSEYYI